MASAEEVVAAFRRAGWVAWQSPPAGHTWKLVDGRYRAVPLSPARTVSDEEVRQAEQLLTGQEA